MNLGKRRFVMCMAAVLAACGLAAAQEVIRARLGTPFGVDEPSAPTAANGKPTHLPDAVVKADLAQPAPASPPTGPASPSTLLTSLRRTLLGPERHSCGSVSPCEPWRSRAWVSGEYLLWHTSGQSLPPLVTTSLPDTPLAAAGLLGQPTSAVLFGDRSYDDAWRSGGRLTVGLWLDPYETLAVQSGFLMLDNAANRFTAVSSGSPLLAIPFFDPSGTPQRLITAYPGVAFGGVDIQTTSQLYAVDVDAVLNLRTSATSRWDALVGWRHVRLGESLRLRDLESLVDDGSLADQVLVEDQFVTRNQFHGVDLGLSGSWRRSFWSLDFLTRVALGGNRQTLDIGGVTRDLSGSVLPGGIFALSSNAGHHARTVFSVVPEVNLRLGCQVTRRVRLIVGYTFLYFDDVLRPGTEIDNTINPDLLPPATPGGPARPAVQFRNVDFWAHGVSFGGEVRW